MKYQVIYYTRTGNSKRIAEKIAKKLNTSIIEIKDDKRWKGFFGYIKAGFYSSSNKEVKMFLSESLNDYEQLIVVAPLWAGGMASAVRAFFKMYPKDMTHLVVTSLGSKVKGREEYMSVTDIIQKEKNEDEKILKLIEALI